MRAVVFDLDDTLAASKSPLDPAMATALTGLLERLPVCIISGGRFEQFQTQVLDRLDAPEPLLERLHLMPTCGTRYDVRRDGAWVRVYATDLCAPDKLRIAAALESASRRLGYWVAMPWGPLIEDRGSQLTYSALGQSAPLHAKVAWDPDGAKKRALVADVSALLPDLEVRGGGSTSVDVTRRGIDKAYGIRKLLSILGGTTDQLLFVGDRLDEGGNDRPVLELGVPCVAVSGWRDTMIVISQFTRWWDGDVRSPGYSIHPAAQPVVLPG
jgi:phosphomannomutase